jgi:hypothetical protein
MGVDLTQAGDASRAGTAIMCAESAREVKAAKGADAVRR